jgi:hypothetical protein
MSSVQSFAMLEPNSNSLAKYIKKQSKTYNLHQVLFLYHIVQITMLRFVIILYQQPEKKEKLFAEKKNYIKIR